MMDIVAGLLNARILKRACCLTTAVLAVMLLCTNSSGSAKVHSGIFEGNTRWYYDTRTKTVIIDCKGRMEDGGQHGVSMDWREWYLKSERVVFKRGITHIGKFAYDNFRKVKEVVLPEGLGSIRYAAFRNTSELKRISFPYTLKKIEKLAFSGSGIQSVSLKYVEKVESEAFSGAELRHVTIPAGTSFGSYAFCYCEELKSVRIEKGVKTISHSMFLRSGLRTVTIPSSVTEIGAYAFFAFSPEEGKLKKVTIRSTRIKKWGKEIFGKARKDLVIRVPKRKKKEYTKALRKGGLPEYVKIVGM